MKLQKLISSLGLVGVCASSAVAQISFSFNYTGSHWTTERRSALESAATALTSYFVSNTPVTITYDVASEEDANSSTLASAGSGFSATPGFHRTIVQEKILGGNDLNGADADGSITWNFGHNWALGDTVANDQYDFKSTAMHEVLHSFGFSGSLSPSTSTTTPDAFYLFDSFLTDSNGIKVINADTFTFQNAAALTGNSLFFGGANAMAAYNNQLVPIYSPSPYESGSSAAHTSDTVFTGTNGLMMNAATVTGPGVRTLSAIELGILTDIGYTVTSSAIPEPATSVALLGLAALGFAVSGRRKRRA